MAARKAATGVIPKTRRARHDGQPLRRAFRFSSEDLAGRRAERPFTLVMLVMSILVVLAVGLVLVVLVVQAVENWIVFRPPRYPQGFTPPERVGLRVEEVWLTAKDGVKLNAWFLPSPSSRKVLLWLHGNGEYLGYGIGRLQVYSALGANILALDYRGYGKSGGSPDEMGVYRDADAAYDHLVAGRNVRPEDIFIFGHSLGGAVAIDLASRRKCGGLIVESAFTTARDMARRIFRIPLFVYLARSRYECQAKISQVGAPVLLVHGTRDTVCPFSMGQRLFEAAPEPKIFLPVEGAGHNDVLEVGGNLYLKQLGAFMGVSSSAVAPARS